MERLRLFDLETPALTVDLDRLAANLSRTARYASGHGFALRPHIKTHKTPEIAKMQIAEGASGITVAKVGEAEVMAEAGIGDILVAYPVIGEPKLRRLTALARRVTIRTALDSPEAARGLSEAAQAAGVEIGVRAEADLGLHRCGYEPGERLVDLAKTIDRLPGLRLEGAQFYAGHLWPPDPDGAERIAGVAAGVRQIVEDFSRAGLPLDVISGGTTPTLFRSHEIPGMTEIRPGTYVFNDRTQQLAGACTWDDCAAAVLVTVVSAPRPGYVIIDAGSKTFSSDSLPHAEDAGYGRVVEAPEAKLYKMNEEHGYLGVRETGREFRIGDKLRVIPNHICVCVNLHEKIHAVRGEDVEAVWTVAARGKLQ